MGTNTKIEADLRIAFRRVKSGEILATARVVTAEDVHWYRVTLPAGTDLATMYRTIILNALRGIERHGGPAVRMVSYRGALPAGDG